MKNKNFLRVLAIVCVLVLCVGVLAACNKGSGGGNQGDGTGGVAKPAVAEAPATKQAPR